MAYQIRPIRLTTNVPIAFNQTYVPIQAPKQEEPIANMVAKLVSYGINLAITDPKKAEEFAKTCMVIGGVGLGIWALVKILN
jgi:hypothetical protein